MWCRSCNIELTDERCPVCGSCTVEDIPAEIHWCNTCQIPVIQQVSQADKGVCPICGNKLSYMSTDLRPVFPEERLLLEILLEFTPNSLIGKSVWVDNSRYFIDGKAVSLPNSLFMTADADAIAEIISKNKANNDYKFFEDVIKRFIVANSSRLNYLKDEACQFVKKEASKFPEENIVISFSGGKDSTATADVVIKSLSNPNLVHIFGDTTLEFPYTIEYAKRYRQDHPHAIFNIAKNNCSDAISNNFKLKKITFRIFFIII